jgi:hypothetical protein
MTSQTHVRPPLRFVRLLMLVAFAAWCGQSNLLAQDGTKGTDPSGAYNVNAAGVIAGRPGEKANPEPASSSSSSGATPKSKSGKKPRKGPPNNATPASQLTSSGFAYSVDKTFPQGAPPRGHEYVRIGVTIWRLSPTECPIADCPLPTGSSKSLVDTATRIEDNSPLSTGERVRLALESLSHSAFIYIVDREQFADGTLGNAYLIFPTRNINGGKNWAQPGLQIQLPRADGCFCVKSRNPQKDLVADRLIVIVSPTQLLGSDEIGEREILMPTKLAGLVKLAEQARTYRGSLQGGGGLTQTPQEVRAGSKGLFDTAPVLTRSDLPPQNFYQSSTPKGSSAVFSFSLRYSSGARP